MPKQEPLGEGPDVSVSGSQGIQVGSGNTMYASWGPKPPVDPVALAALNPHTAVARLQKLSHDELVDFFARALPSDVSEILKIFYNAEEERVITILGDLNQRKATELVSMLSEGRGDPLNVLPKAAEGIARKAASLWWTDPGPLISVGIGYGRKYKDGHVFWSDEFGARTTTGVIDVFVMGHPGYGVAASDQEVAPTSPYGTKSIRQAFQRGVVYASEFGVYRVADESKYQDEGGSGGWLGFPTGDQRRNPMGYDQPFEGAMMGQLCPVSAIMSDRTWESTRS